MFPPLFDGVSATQMASRKKKKKWFRCSSSSEHIFGCNSVRKQFGGIQPQTLGSPQNWPTKGSCFVLCMGIAELGSPERHRYAMLNKAKRLFVQGRRLLTGMMATRDIGTPSKHVLQAKVWTPCWLWVEHVES